MFTVLHERDDGSRDFYSAARLQNIPRTADNEGSWGMHMLCGPDDAAPGIAVGTLRDGHVYVMNDKGATVASISLYRAEPQPV